MFGTEQKALKRFLVIHIFLFKHQIRGKLNFVLTLESPWIFEMIHKSFNSMSPVVFPSIGNIIQFLEALNSGYFSSCW